MQISEKDEGVLEHLIDITEEELDPEEGETGFRLTFHFAKNPYFPHETLVGLAPRKASPLLPQLGCLDWWLFIAILAHALLC